MAEVHEVPRRVWRKCGHFSAAISARTENALLENKYISTFVYCEIVAYVIMINIYEKMSSILKWYYKSITY